MKLLIKISVLLAMLIVYTACEDNRLDNVPQDSLYFLKSGLQRPVVYNFGPTEYDVVVIKSGLGDQSANVDVALNSQLITDYNTANGTSFQLLPENCYTLSATKTTIAEDGARFISPVTLKTAEMGKLTNPSNYILPFQIQSNIDMVNGKTSLLLAPEFVEPYLYFTKASEISVVGINPEAETSRGYVNIAVNYPNEWNLTYDIEVDKIALDDYNAENGTTFEVFPDGTYSIDQLDWYLLSGTNSRNITISFSKNALNDAKKYLLPLRIKNVSKWGVDPENDVQLISVKSSAPVLLDKTGWTILECNSNISYPGGGSEWLMRGPESMIDGLDTEFTYAAGVPTFWSAKSGDPLPIYASVDMQAQKTISKFEVHNPGGGDSWRSTLKKGYLEISTDGTSWTKAADWEFPNVNTPSVSVTLESMVAARYVKLVVTETFGGVVTVRELEIYGFE